MKEIVAFIITWILFWLLIALIAWFVNPGVAFRVCAGFKAVAYITIMIGWIPATIVAVEVHESQD